MLESFATGNIQTFRCAFCIEDAQEVIDEALEKTQEAGAHLTIEVETTGRWRADFSSTVRLVTEPKVVRLFPSSNQIEVWSNNQYRRLSPLHNAGLTVKITIKSQPIKGAKEL